jgi:hypothetical protein
MIAEIAVNIFDFGVGLAKPAGISVEDADFMPVAQQCINEVCANKAVAADN